MPVPLTLRRLLLFGFFYVDSVDKLYGFLGNNRGDGMLVNELLVFLLHQDYKIVKPLDDCL